MKKLFVILTILVLYSNLSAQKIKEEKLLSSVPNTDFPYNFICDTEGKSYVYVLYDSITEKSSFVSNKGNSKSYYFINNWNVKFDDDGNYYAIAEDKNYAPDEDSGSDIINNPGSAYILKNGKEIYTMDSYQGNIEMNDGKLYFVETIDEKSRVVNYDISKAKFNQGKIYDNINTCVVNSEGGHEPYFALQFNSDNEVYYIGVSNNQEFMVVGDKEQVRCQKIEVFYVKLDLKGQVTYIATFQNDEDQYSCVVQGDKIYDRVPYISGPIVFTDDNIPVYTGSSEYLDLSYGPGNFYVVQGNKKGSTHFGYVSYVTTMPNGDVAYIINDTASGTFAKSTIYINGKKNKTYNQIYDFSVTPDNKLLYAASNDSLFFVVRDGKENPAKYSNIFDLQILPNNDLFFIGENYEQAEGSEVYYHLGSKKFGPYTELPYGGEDYGMDLVKMDEDGNFALLTFTKKPGSDDSTFYQLLTGKWNSDYFEYIDYVNIYDGDVYYMATNSNYSKANIYKNKKSLGEYGYIYNFKFNADDDEITFIGFKDTGVYRVKISL